MSKHDYQCPQCVGYGCAWCQHTGRLSEDRLREVRTEDAQMNDDRDWARDRMASRGDRFE